MLSVKSKKKPYAKKALTPFPKGEVKQKVLMPFEIKSGTLFDIKEVSSLEKYLSEKYSKYYSKIEIDMDGESITAYDIEALLFRYVVDTQDDPYCCGATIMGNFSEDFEENKFELEDKANLVALFVKNIIQQSCNPDKRHKVQRALSTTIVLKGGKRPVSDTDEIMELAIPKTGLMNLVLKFRNPTSNNLLGFYVLKDLVNL